MLRTAALLLPGLTHFWTSPDVVRRLTELAAPMREELGDSLTGATGRGLRPPGRSQ
jgi:hypothetical protein